MGGVFRTPSFLFVLVMVEKTENSQNALSGRDKGLICPTQLEYHTVYGLHTSTP